SELLQSFHFRDQPQNVLAHVLRPRVDQALEGFVRLAVERAGRFLEVGQVAAHRPHEAGDAVAKAAGALGSRLSLACFIDQTADCGRDAVRLVLEPIPVAREQRYLASDNAELWPAGTGFGGPGARPLENVIERSAEVEVDLLTADILEYQDTIVITVGILLDFRQDAVSISGGYAPSSGEGGVHDLLVIRVRHDENYIQVK